MNCCKNCISKIMLINDKPSWMKPELGRTCNKNKNCEIRNFKKFLNCYLNTFAQPIKKPVQYLDSKAMFQNFILGRTKS